MPSKELTEEARQAILIKIGKVLQQLRERRNLTQQEEADILGIPRSGVSLMEDGKRGVDAPEVLKLSEVFHKSPNELLEKGKETNVTVNSKFNEINFSLSENQTVQAARNKPEFTNYIYSSLAKKIISGWNFREEAEEAMEKYEVSAATELKTRIGSKEYLKSRGIDPDNNEFWA